MVRFPRFLAFVPLVLLTACATTAADIGLRPSQPAPRVSSADGNSAYGLFLAGQAALGEGNAREAMTLLMAARAAGAQDPEVIDNAFLAAVLAGEIREAARIAPQGPDGDQSVRQLGDLTRAISALADGRAMDGFAILSEAGFDDTNRAAAALLKPLAADLAGVKDSAVVRPDQRIDRVVQYFGQLSQSQVFERLKRYDEAETGYKIIAGPQSPTFALFAIDYGEFLERRKRRAEAVALYDMAIQRGRPDPALTRARARAAAGRTPPRLATPMQQIGRVLVASASLHAADGDREGALAYVRLALAADPNRLEAWLLVGDLLSDANQAEALAAYARAPRSSDLYVQAMAKTAWTLREADDKAGALATARAALSARPESQEAAITLAEILRAEKQTDEAVRLLDGLIARAGDTADWRLLYLRGTTLAMAGRGLDSERDLEAALALAPDEPELLNYLGYMWIDRGVNLPKAMAMVQRAVAQRPRSGAIIDSLGWAQYRLGDYRAAVQTLERAALLEPGDPEINDHLGDAYWRVGRRIEAEFQWNRVLTLEPSDEIKARVEAKLKSGLEPAAPPPAAPPPAAETTAASAGAPAPTPGG
jgi:tetratricopeptide (TPR) repeat protein